MKLLYLFLSQEIVLLWMKTASFSAQPVAISHTWVDSVYPLICFEPFRVCILLIDKNTIPCSSKDIVPIVL